MKICLAQTRPVKGDIQSNIDHHKTLINLAVANGAGIIIFPELSLTGYEPALAEELAIHPDDERLEDFQQISDSAPVIIGVGIPTQNNGETCISMILFQPGKVRQVYSKKYLHVDEEGFFTSGQNFTGSIGRQSNIALAICYELSVPEHAQDAYDRGAEIYIASVAKSAAGVEQAGSTLSGISNKYAMTVLMANCVGHCDDIECGGKTAVWNSKGALAAELNDTNEGILIFDTDTQDITKKQYVISQHQ
ncbi:MAG: carbon-nitrogen hydrolase family protein [Ferruginibacter sp.]|nr:carbon-nitrogen hydrolase family protein [Ferruginibacter sp.]